MVLHVYDQARDINYPEAGGCDFHSVTSWPNARKCVQSRRVGSRAGGGVTVDVDQLQLDTCDAQSSWIHDLSRDSSSFELCQSRMHKTGNE